MKNLILKPGSHIAAGTTWKYCSDMRTEAAATLLLPTFTAGTPAKLTRVQLRRYAGGKALRWLELAAAHVLIRSRSSPGGTGGYNAGVLAAYEKQA